MLSTDQISNHVKYALDGDIERLTVRTGCGLLYDMSRISQGDRLYMGLEGHTEAESKEAMDPANINTSKTVTQHKHDLISTFPDDKFGDIFHPQFHDADFKHYQWQIHTVAPLYFEVRITPYYTHIEFIQPLPRPTKMFINVDQQPLFKYATGPDITYVTYPYNNAQTLAQNPTLIGTYQRIFDECSRIYYLYCSSITRTEAMGKMYSRYGVYSK